MLLRPNLGYIYKVAENTGANKCKHMNNYVCMFSPKVSLLPRKARYSSSFSEKTEAPRIHQLKYRGSTQALLSPQPKTSRLNASAIFPQKPKHRDSSQALFSPTSQNIALGSSQALFSPQAKTQRLVASAIFPYKPKHSSRLVASAIFPHKPKHRLVASAIFPYKPKHSSRLVASAIFSTSQNTEARRKRYFPLQAKT
ncbi:hypothetical protein RRG08_017427 [Elysia crispata]|uniref:Uncharacterized protein n=1 Tax=Elysia crispata TaxID=231223 RepID=A0AAE1E9W6_9GAST|nr:hypothetical protein RRG08_017427 [Elysia crispata]